MREQKRGEKGENKDENVKKKSVPSNSLENPLEKKNSPIEIWAGSII